MIITEYSAAYEYNLYHRSELSLGSAYSYYMCFNGTGIWGGETLMCTRFKGQFWSTQSWGLTTPNAAPIEIHVKCLNSMGQFNLFLTISTCSVAYHDKTWSVLFQKQVRYMFGSQTDFELQSMSCIHKGQTSSKLALIFTLCYRPDTHPFNTLYPCEIIMKQLYLTSYMTGTTCAY